MLSAIFGASGLAGTLLGFLASLVNDWLAAYRRDQDLERLGAAQEAAGQAAAAAEAAAQARQIELDAARAGGAGIDPDVFRKDP